MNRLVLSMMAAVMLVGGDAVPSEPVEPGRAYELLLPDMATVQVRVVRPIDSCWIEATVVGSDSGALAKFNRWNLCRALALRSVAASGDEFVVDRRSVLAVDEEAADVFVAVADRAEFQRLLATGRVLVVDAGVRAVILEVGAGTNRVRVLDGASSGRAGLLFQNPW